uniref:Zinc finger E-box binding homeobox 2 n=3 Tax=Boreoeutheria TaxID=1437010 RepID=A0A2K6JLY3_RHIBE
MTHFEDIEPACCRSRAPSPCELPSDPLLSMKQPIMADGPRCKRRKQANPRRKN